MRKSSKGNPYHDELGRFTTSDGCKTRSERTPEEYEKRTRARKKQTLFNGDVNEGLRITEKDGKYHAQVQRKEGTPVTVKNLGGDNLSGKITEVHHDNEGRPYYRVEYRYSSGQKDTMLIGDDLLDDWMTSDDIQRDKTAADRLRAENMHRYAKGEVLFLNRDKRCHASIVDHLPEKTSRWAHDYAEIGRYEHKGKTYKVFRDRDDLGQFAYFALEDKGE